MSHLVLNDTLTPLSRRATAVLSCAQNTVGYPVGYWFRDRHA
ncbi:hypothetical protein C8D72_2467 [Kushneria indalinina DSM 14324]|uniref:Uncharacterized protein n=1 Tax=Kushneria indalinina DSM 14324 TaxID=1122140 RepID=A0A3D9DTJ3_9GAMM|nr:hypothetical protein C8D72_2467 [Kushneria indalinina DSM 14324]